MIKIRSNKIRWALSAILAVLILFGTFHSIFSLAAFAIFGLMLVFVDRESILLQVFFIMPMANIFKMSPGSQSFFTILILAYVVIHLVLPRKATLLVVLFAVYIIIGELMVGEFNFFRTIKLICNVLFLSSILNNEVTVRHKEVFLSYITGNIVSSVWAMLDSSMFKIVSYIGIEEVGGLNQDDSVIRFTGLYTDPNYYAVGLIISLCLLVVLYHREEIKPLLAVLFTIPIIYFLIQTYSKSAIFMLSIPFLVLLYSLYSKKKHLVAIFLLLAVVVVVYLALSGWIPALDVVIARINASATASGTDINALTTGRFNLWIIYAEYLINHIKAALFGVGINAALINDKAAHNTYLDVFYHLGAVGGFLLVSLLTVISGQSRRVRIRRNPTNFCVMACIFIMYFFLSELFYFDPPFHIFLAFTALNLPDNNKEKIPSLSKGC